MNIAHLIYQALVAILSVSAIIFFIGLVLGGLIFLKTFNIIREIINWRK